MDAFPHCPEVCVTQPFLTLPILLLQSCPPVKLAPFLWDGGKILLWFQTQAVLHSYYLILPKMKIATNSKNHSTINYYCCVGCFIEPTFVRTFSSFSLGDLAFVHSTQHSFTLPHTSTLIQTPGRGGRLRTNCSCMKCFIIHTYIHTAVYITAVFSP